MGRRGAKKGRDETDETAGAVDEKRLGEYNNYTLVISKFHMVASSHTKNELFVLMNGEFV